MNIKRIYILGAGSSIGHSSKLFPSITGFFPSAKSLGILKDESEQLKNYIEKFMGKNILSSRKRDLVNIEELFTHIEIEIEREASPELLKMRQQILYLIQNVLIRLQEILINSSGEYDHFVKMIEKRDTIISFNWDLLLDNKLKREAILKDRYDIKRDSRILSGHYWRFIQKLTAFGEQTNIGITIGAPSHRWNPEEGFYLKAHGSIDWVYCKNDSCRAYRKVFPLLDLNANQQNRCSECAERLEFLIIPPVLNKGYRQYPLIRRIWNLASQEIVSANELVIWGYSLPPTDFYSSWLIRKARDAPISKIIIIDPGVYNEKTKKISTSFVRHFYDLFRDRIPKEYISIFESFSDFYKKNDVLTKYKLGSPKEVYRGI